ncbi:Arc family DNA-binding protein [Acetobacter senegalensis]|uniref:Arc family DNA-binding protein n=1 Tax=Acetobacter senegalensis TaxID=446692 RepID=UPI00264AE6F9|nr:Arc family DNA-binding protein [Acetobacter senegalensis]MDN7356320.1 Arc family DNA-binding protein [Acetobacter senegalensis]
MSDRDPLVHIRMPDTLRKTLQQEAKASSRSMNAEIVHRLLESLSLNDAGYTGTDNLELSGIELGLIGIWRDLSEEQRRSVLILLKSIVSNNDAG